MRIILPDLEEQPSQNPSWIEVYYAGKYGYCARLMTEEGNQIGDAFYGSKVGTAMTEQEWEAQHQIDHKYSLNMRKAYRKRLKSGSE